MTPTLRMWSLIVCLLAVVSLTGCSNKITADKVRSDMSPGLKTMAENDQQIKNRHARLVDTQFRQIPDDIDTILLLDRPVRLSPYTIP